MGRYTDLEMGRHYLTVQPSGHFRIILTKKRARARRDFRGRRRGRRGRASAPEEVVFRSLTAGSEQILVDDRRRPFDRSAIYALVDDKGVTGFQWESGTTAKKYFTRGESAEVKKIYIFLFNKVKFIRVTDYCQPFSPSPIVPVRRRYWTLHMEQTAIRVGGEGLLGLKNVFILSQAFYEQIIKKTN